MMAGEGPCTGTTAVSHHSAAALPGCSAGWRAARPRLFCSCPTLPMYKINPAGSTASGRAAVGSPIKTQVTALILVPEYTVSSTQTVVLAALETQLP